MVVKRQIGVCRIQENHAKVCACCLSSIFIKPWSVSVGIMIYYLPQFLLSETGIIDRGGKNRSIVYSSSTPYPGMF